MYLAVCFILLSFTAETEGNRNPRLTGPDTEDLDLSSVREEEIGTDVGTLIAIDSDGDNLTYGIRDTASSSLDGNAYANAKLYLVVDPVSGDVSVHSPIDREVASNIRATWTVSDGTVEITHPPVLIFVTDINDVVPRFQGLKDRLDPVQEDTAVGEVITLFSVIDEDAEKNGLVDVAVVTVDEDCDDDHPFEIKTLSEGKNNFSINVAQELDYEKQSEYTLCFVAEDRAGGSDSLMSNVSKVLIPVRDVQNQPPVFLNLPYTTEILENNEVGSYVIQVTAQDGDRGVLEPNRVDLSLNSTYFEIDSDGVIRTKTVIDREMLEENPFNLNVVAAEVDDNQPINQRVNDVDVVITILDEDDNIPEFSNNSIQVSLFENSPEGTRLNLGVTVTDADELTNAAFSLMLNQSMDAFALVKESEIGSLPVDVRVNNSALIDYEMMQQTNFTIIAFSTVNSTLGGQNVLEVTVNIVNVNDNEPVFGQDQYQGEFAEDVEHGYSILTVHATDGDIGAVITYSINPPVKEFEIGSSSGVITTSSVAEFNALLRNEYVIFVEASDGERVSQKSVTLTCTDVNDNPPVFQRHLNEISEKEFHDDIPRDAIITLTAVDADPTSPNDEVSYFIADVDPADQKFSINGTSGELFFNDSIDYDIGEQTYFLTIGARDHGSPSMEGNTTLTVTILDINDNAPEFNESVYTFSVREDVPREYTVGTVTATDADSGYNGMVAINLIDGGGGVFYIISENNVGSIRVGGGLDRETSPKDGYILNVFAQDRGSPPQSNTCIVNITVVDVNDEKPVFENDPNSDYSVSEDIPVRFNILTLSATDPDENSKLFYEIKVVTALDEKGEKVDGNFSSQFSCNEIDGSISLNEKLDREKVETFRLRGVVRDVNAETGDQIDTVDVTINVEDINDNAPAFTNITEDLSVVEGSARGTIVTTEIRATDPDKGSNGDIVYELVDDAGGAFTIEENTGNLRIHNALLIDREKHENLTITVRASDKGSPVNFTTEKDVIIEIIDINDNAPVFESSTYSGTVSENEKVDKNICKVTANDVDATSMFGDVTYNIAFGNDFKWFKIDSTTGDISVADDGIDREVTDKVTLVVEAVDSGGRKDTTEVAIVIEDVNDNSPNFTYIEEVVTIPEDTPPGSIITTVVAVDSDKQNTSFSLIEYNITGGNGTEFFDIDKETGEVVTIKSLNDNSVPANESRIYEITVQAMDKAPPFNSVSETMIIIVDDAGNNPPVITYPEDGSFLKMPEYYSTIWIPLWNATATDSDAGNDSLIAYRLAEVVGYDWEVFSVDEKNGSIFYTGDPPDWFEHPQFRLILEAYNYLSASEDFDSVEFTINVTDEDNHDPVFPPNAENETATEEMEVQEKLEPGAKVGSVAATDNDDGDPIYYFIIEGNDDGYFRIDMYTGDIFTTEELDGSSLSSTTFYLVIKATEDVSYGEDGSSRKKRETASASYDPSIINVTVNIVDINDNPPYFVKDLYTAGVLYTTEFDVNVTRVSAEDDDPDVINRNMTYSILSQTRLDINKEMKKNDTAFYIDPSTGDIYTKASFLRLPEGVYFELRIEVADPGKNRSLGFFSQTNLLIYVIIEKQQLEMHTIVSADETKDSEIPLSNKLNEILSQNPGGDYETDFDRISSHTAASGQVDKDQSDALFHVVNLTDGVNEIVPAAVVLYYLDHSPKYVDEVRKTFSVQTINLAAYTPEEPKFTSFQFAVIILAGIFFIFLILAIMAFFFFQNQNQKTLKAYGVVIDDNVSTNDEPLTKTANPVFTNPGFEGDDEVDYDVIDRAVSEATTEEKVMTIDDDEEEPPPGDENTRNSKLLKNLLLNQQKLEEFSDLHISDV